MSIVSASAPPVSAATRVGKRLVFYFSGFDPRGPAHYHTLYEAEAKAQAPLNGLNLTVGKRHRAGKLASAWSITAPGGTETEYEFLRWDDIIRRHWPKNEWQLLKSAVPVYWTFLTANLVPRLLKIAWPAALTVSYPIVAFLAPMLIALAAGSIVTLLMLAKQWALWFSLLPALVIVAAAFFLTRWLDHRFRSYWLLRTYGTIQPWAYGKSPALDARIREFAEYIVERIHESDADEVLVVGHSVGTILSIPLVVEMLRLDPELGQRGPKFGLVSLGDCIPLVSLLPRSRKLREDLETVASAPGVHWVDFSARRDGASVTQVDPLKVSGITRRPGIPVRPLLLPVRIFKMFPPDVYKVIKKDLFRIHFQYIMAGEFLTDYDFFAITAGPLGLADRYPEPAAKA